VRDAYVGYESQAVREASYHVINNNPGEKNFDNGFGIETILSLS